MTHVTPIEHYRRVQGVNARPIGAVAELAAGESPGVVAAHLRSLGVRGVHIECHGARRYIVRNVSRTDSAPPPPPLQRAPSSWRIPVAALSSGVGGTLAIVALVYILAGLARWLGAS